MTNDFLFVYLDKQQKKSGNTLFFAGDFRLPKAMLTSPVDGSRIDVNTAYPNKGIVRGTRTQSSCSFQTSWNMYKCEDITYKMLILESLDADTERRRLSPVAIASEGGVILV